jgi:nicotinamidase-related amidase
LSVSLLIIDPQNDFCSPEGALYVPGADADCKRLASFIVSHTNLFDSIHFTADAHDYYNIAHPSFWETPNGGEPLAFTQISGESFARGDFLPRDSSLTSYVKRYIDELEKRGSYRLTLWPAHCVVGAWGFCFDDGVREALRVWQRAKNKGVNYVLKGRNALTEHYSAIRAEVPVNGDSATQTNHALLDALKNDSAIITAGEALSHCVAFTLTDIASHVDAKKITLLADCASSVSGFEDEGKAFVKNLCAKGMNVTTTPVLLGATTHT